jgi:hypothetical protein
MTFLVGSDRSRSLKSLREIAIASAMTIARAVGAAAGLIASVSGSTDRVNCVP